MTITAILLQSIAMALFILGAMAFAALLRGCMRLRRAAREGLRSDPALLTRSPLAPGISVLTSPADASSGSREFVRRLVDQQYNRHQVVVVLNDPAAADLLLWKSAFSNADPRRLQLVERKAGPASEVMQAGVEAAAGPLISWVDRASEFNPDLLSRLVGPMLADPATVGVWSWAPVLPSHDWVGRYASLESLRHWLSGCARQTPVSGSAMLVRKDALVKTDAFEDGPLGLFGRLKGRIAFAPDASYRLKTPGSWAELRRMAQRDRRWFPAAIETLAYPLAMVGWWFGWIDSALAGVVLLTTVGIGIVNSMGAVVLWELTGDPNCNPERLTMLFLAAIPENLGYRQMRNLWLIAKALNLPAKDKS